jgi:hypothetical protein
VKQFFRLPTRICIFHSSCIQWSRTLFDDLFISGADAVNSLLENREQFLQKLKQDKLAEPEALKQVKNWLELAAAPSFEQCAKVLFLEFVKNYRNAINDLTHAFPKDARIKDNATGADLGLFWHGHKRFPASTEFDINNPAHVDYIYHGANILASVFRIPEQSREQVHAMLPKIFAQDIPWKPKATLSEKEEMDRADACEREDLECVERVTAELRSLDLSMLSCLSSAHFMEVSDCALNWVKVFVPLPLHSLTPLFVLSFTHRTILATSAGSLLPQICVHQPTDWDL